MQKEVETSNVWKGEMGMKKKHVLYGLEITPNLSRWCSNLLRYQAQPGLVI